MNTISTRSRLLIGGIAAVLLVAVLLTAIFFKNGTVAQPSSFVATDQTHFHFIEWQKKSDGTITGQWTLLVQQPDQNMPTVASLPPVQGQITDQTVTLNAGTQASIQGTIDGSRLSGDTTANGQSQPLTWYAATSDQADQLEAAFTKYEQLHSQIVALQATLAHPPADSDPASYAVQLQNAQTTALNLQQRASALRQLGNVCGTGELAIFETQYPPAPNTFEVAPYPTAAEAAAHSSLAQQVQTAQSSWNAASTASVPAIAGLSLPWRIGATTYQSQINQAQKTLTSLQRLLETDYQNMAIFQQETQAAGASVQQLRQAGGC